MVKVENNNKRKICRTKTALDKIKPINTNYMCALPSKGALCSVRGKQYEVLNWNIMSKCWFQEERTGEDDSRNVPFCTQPLSELGGSSCNFDLVGNFRGLCNVPIEVKKVRALDYVQMSLKFVDNKWSGSARSKLPPECVAIFESFLKSATFPVLFGGVVPPFMVSPITHAEWVRAKSNTPDFNDKYVDCPDDTIKELYRAKGCKYIQISSKGLFHLGDDMCGFGVPEFLCPQRFRIRTKIHKRTLRSGYCDLSVTISCQPRDLKVLEASPFSLDNASTLPSNLIFVP